MRDHSVHSSKDVFTGHAQLQHTVRVGVLDVHVSHDRLWRHEGAIQEEKERLARLQLHAPTQHDQELCKRPFPLDREESCTRGTSLVSFVSIVGGHTDTTSIGTHRPNSFFLQHVGKKKST